MSGESKKAKRPPKVAALAKAAVATAKAAIKAQPNERKAKVVAALKRLHPMD